MTKLPFDRRSHLVLINGQGGTVSSDISEREDKKGSLLDFLADLLDD